MLAKTPRLFVGIVVCLMLGGCAARVATPTAPQELQPPPTVALEPWNGEVRIAMSETDAFDSIGAEDEVIESTVQDMLESLGLSARVVCINLSRTSRRGSTLHAQMAVSFPEGGYPAQRQAAVNLLASLGPMTDAYE